MLQLTFFFSLISSLVTTPSSWAQQGRRRRRRRFTTSHGLFLSFYFLISSSQLADKIVPIQLFIRSIAAVSTFQCFTFLVGTSIKTAFREQNELAHQHLMYDSAAAAVESLCSRDLYSRAACSSRRLLCQSSRCNFNQDEKEKSTTAAAENVATRPGYRKYPPVSFISLVLLESRSPPPSPHAPPRHHSTAARSPISGRLSRIVADLDPLNGGACRQHCPCVSAPFAQPSYSIGCVESPVKSSRLLLLRQRRSPAQSLQTTEGSTLFQDLLTSGYVPVLSTRLFFCRFRRNVKRGYPQQPRRKRQRLFFCFALFFVRFSF